MSIFAHLVHIQLTSVSSVCTLLCAQPGKSMVLSYISHITRPTEDHWQVSCKHACTRTLFTGGMHIVEFMDLHEYAIDLHTHF